MLVVVQVAVHQFQPQVVMVVEAVQELQGLLIQAEAVAALPNNLLYILMEQ
jgi:hypothetical protein